MKTTFDLPEPLLRRAKAAAALRGGSLRDLVAEALTAKLAADDAASRTTAPALSDWKSFKESLVLQPDGTYFNPNGIEDERFFEILDTLRAERMSQPLRNPFEGFDLDAQRPPPEDADQPRGDR